MLGSMLQRAAQGACLYYCGHNVYIENGKLVMGYKQQNPQILLQITELTQIRYDSCEQETPLRLQGRRIRCMHTIFHTVSLSFTLRLHFIVVSLFSYCFNIYLFSVIQYWYTDIFINVSCVSQLFSGYIFVHINFITCIKTTTATNQLLI